MTSRNASSASALSSRAKSSAPAGPPRPASQTVRRGAGRASSRTDQKRLAELKVKLGDPDYMEGAILRIATVLSARLTLR